MALLEVRGLRAGYDGIPVVFGVDLDVDEGEIVAVLGSNGAGKTTTLRAISGMIEPIGGTISFEGRDITRMHAERVARLGLMHVPEGRGIFPSINVADTLRLAAALAGADASERLDDAYGIFPKLRDRASQLAGTLSGGEQQMLALARGLIARPRLLMVDEMSQGLAPTLVAELFERIRSFPERGVSVLLVEQFVGKALGMASRAYVIEKGEIAYAGPASKLARNEEFVRGSYLGQIEGRRPPAAPRRRERFAESVEVKLPPALLRSLEERAARERVPMQQLIGELVSDHVTEPRANGARKGTKRKRSAPRRRRRSGGAS
jgi:branched-chain amino acid transport system ATP-binding protein